MSSTNKTTHYELPQYVENDIFNPLVDDNDAYQKIDTALYQIANAEAETAGEIVSLKNRVTGTESDIDALEAQNGSAVLTTVAQTLSEAVNELNAGEQAIDARVDIVEDAINNPSTGLAVKMASAENNITSLGNRMTTAEGDIDALESKVDIAEDKLLIDDFFKNKKILILGDSNSIEGEDWRGRTWVTDFREILAHTGATIDNNSESGRRFAKPDSSFTLSLVDTVDALSADTYDYIIVFVGINDWNNHTPLGDLNHYQNWDYSLFSDALRYSFQKLFTLYPTASIFAMSPLKCNYANPTIPLIAYEAAMRNVCVSKSHTYNFIDGFCAPAYAVNGSNPTTYSKDGLHPNDAYAPILARYIIASMMNGGSPKSVESMTKNLTINSNLASGTAFITYFANGETELFMDATIDTPVYESFISDIPTFAVGNYGASMNMLRCNNSSSTEIIPASTANGSPYPDARFYSAGDRYIMREKYRPVSMNETIY